MRVRKDSKSHGLNFIKGIVPFWDVSDRKYIRFFHSGAEPDCGELEPIHCNLGLTLRQRNYSPLFTPVWDFLDSFLALRTAVFNLWPVAFGKERWKLSPEDTKCPWQP